MAEHIYYRQWEVDEPRAVLYIVHGLGEHCGRYDAVANWFNERGVSVYSGDYPGFGRTAGKKGHVDSFEQILSAIHNGWQKMIDQHPSIPHLLLGHSLGGLLVTKFLYDYGHSSQIDGVLISSPAYRPSIEIPTWKKKLAQFLTPIVPSLTIPSGLPADAISRDHNVVERYKSDPYVHDKVSLRFYAQMTQLMQDVVTHTDRLPMDIPIYWMQAGADKLVDPLGTKEYFEKLPAAPHRKFKMWDGLYHEILNEPEKEQVLQEIWAFFTEFALK